MGCNKSIFGPSRKLLIWILFTAMRNFDKGLKKMFQKKRDIIEICHLNLLLNSFSLFNPIACSCTIILTLSWPNQANRTRVIRDLKNTSCVVHIFFCKKINMITKLLGLIKGKFLRVFHLQLRNSFFKLCVKSFLIASKFSEVLAVSYISLFGLSALQVRLWIVLWLEI